MKKQRLGKYIKVNAVTGHSDICEETADMLSLRHSPVWLSGKPCFLLDGCDERNRCPGWEERAVGVKRGERGENQTPSHAT